MHERYGRRRPPTADTRGILAQLLSKRVDMETCDDAISLTTVWVVLPVLWMQSVRRNAAGESIPIRIIHEIKGSIQEHKAWRGEGQGHMSAVRHASGRQKASPTGARFSVLSRLCVRTHCMLAQTLGNHRMGCEHCRLQVRGLFVCALSFSLSLAQFPMKLECPGPPHTKIREEYACAKERQ